MTAIAELIHQRLFGPSDTISHQGAYNDPFYILAKGEVVGYRRNLADAGKTTKVTERSKGFGFWNERLLIYDSPVDTSIAAMGFVETHAMNGADVRAVLKRFPSGFKVTRHLVVVRLWRMAFSKESLKFARIRMERQRLKKKMLESKKLKLKHDRERLDVRSVSPASFTEDDAGPREDSPDKPLNETSKN